jgi:hypothetical protein
MELKSEFITPGDSRCEKCREVSVPVQNHAQGAAKDQSPSQRGKGHPLGKSSQMLSQPR